MRHPERALPGKSWATRPRAEANEPRDSGPVRVYPHTGSPAGTPLALHLPQAHRTRPPRRPGSHPLPSRVAMRELGRPLGPLGPAKRRAGYLVPMRFPPVVPTPKQVRPGRGTLRLQNGLPILLDPEASEADFATACALKERVRELKSKEYEQHGSGPPRAVWRDFSPKSKSWGTH